VGSASKKKKKNGAQCKKRLPFVRHSLKTESFKRTQSDNSHRSGYPALAKFVILAFVKYRVTINDSFVFKTLFFEKRMNHL
jgi:hypothetical protein